MQLTIRTKMKSPQSPLYIIGFLCFTLSLFSQTKSLTVLTPSVYPVVNEKTIMETTGDSENHKILLAAVKAADLEKVLGQSGPFTFFAPSDNAFSKFSSEELKHLFNEDNKKVLKDLLTYHIVAGNLSASKMLRAMCSGRGSASFTTVQGAKITATMKGTDIILTDSLGNTAKITVADASQSNGVIHEIDTVILPTEL